MNSGVTAKGASAVRHRAPARELGGVSAAAAVPSGTAAASSSSKHITLASLPILANTVDKGESHCDETRSKVVDNASV